jgi:hypothetical protein
VSSSPFGRTSSSPCSQCPGSLISIPYFGATSSSFSISSFVGGAAVGVASFYYSLYPIFRRNPVKDHNAVNRVSVGGTDRRNAHCGGCGVCWKCSPEFVELVLGEPDEARRLISKLTAYGALAITDYLKARLLIGENALSSWSCAFFHRWH